MSKRLELTIRKCADCPFCWLSTDTGEDEVVLLCTKLGKELPTSATLPAWCPLPDDYETLDKMRFGEPWRIGDQK